MAKIRVGVVGGGMGRGHAIAYKAAERADLVWVAELDEARGKAVAEEAGCAAITDWVAGLDQVDAVSICTPHHLHAPMTIKALEAGKHVLVEKPMANSEAECQAMMHAAKANDRKLMVAYVVRYYPAVKWLKQVLDEKRYGEILNVEAWTEGFLQPRPGTWFAKRDQLGGGVLFSHGCHYIDIILWYLGLPSETRFLSTRKGTEWMEGEGTAHALMAFPNGALAHYVASWGLRNSVLSGMQIHCTDALLILNYGKQTVEAVTKAGRETIFSAYKEGQPRPAGGTVLGEVEHFLDCIETGREPETDGNEALKSLRVVWSMYEQDAAAPERSA